MSSSQLELVKNYCCQLDDNRVTARKKAEQEIRSLFNNSSIRGALDSVSKRGNGRDWTWQDVFRSAFKYVKIETDKMLSDSGKNNLSDVKMKQRIIEVMSFFRLIIDKGKKYLTWSTVVADLLSMFDYQFMRKHYSEYILGFLSLAISHPVSRSLIAVNNKLNQWHQIFDNLLHILEDPPNSVQPIKPAELLHNLLLHGSKMTCLMEVFSKDRLWELMRGMLVKEEFARSDSDAKLLVLKAANILIHYSGLEFREKCVILGEAAMRAVLKIWQEKREATREAVLDFLMLQVVLHHPKGVSDPADGAMYNDRSLWTQHLKRIFVNIIDSTIKNKRRTNHHRRNSRNQMNFLLSRDLVKIGAEVIFQFADSPDSPTIGDITQYVDLDQTQESPAKKRRVSGEELLGFDLVLKETMRLYDLEEMIIPWLQLLAEMIFNHPEKAVCHGDHIVGVMSHLLSSLKKGVTREHVHHVLENIVKLCTMKPEQWTSIAHGMVTALSANQLQEHGHRLLRQLLKKRTSLKIVISDVYSVFRNKMIKLDSLSAGTLLLLMSLSPINDAKDKSLRGQLLSWLSSQVTCENEIFKMSSDMAETLGPLLSSLTNKNSVNPEGHPIKNKTPVISSRYYDFERNLSVLLCIGSSSSDVLKKQETQVQFENYPETTKVSSIVESVDQMLINLAAEAAADSKDDSDPMPIMNFLYFLQCYLNSECVKREKLLMLSWNVLKDVVKQIEKLGEADDERLLNRNMGTVKDLTTLIQIMDHESPMLSNLVSQISKLSLEIVVKGVKVRKAKLKLSRRSGSRSRSHSRDNSPDAFDDFGMNDNSSFNSEDEDMSQFDIDQENLKIKLLGTCLVLSARASKLVLDKVETQKQIISLLSDLLVVCEFSEASLETIVPVFEALKHSGVESSIVDDIGDLLRDVASQSMSPKMLKYEGIVNVTRAIVSIIPVVSQNDGSPREVIVKILSALVKSNLASKNARLDSVIINAICDVMDEMARCGAEASWAVWPLHNQLAPQLASDADEELVYQSLPAFLGSPYANIRIKVVELVALIVQKSKVKYRVFDNLILPMLNDTNALSVSYCLLAALGHHESSLTTVLLSKLMLIQANNTSAADDAKMTRAVEMIIKGKDNEDALKSSLAYCVDQFLRDGNSIVKYPKFLYGYGTDKAQFKKFIVDEEKIVVPLMLLHNPTEDCLTKLAKLLDKSPEQVIKANFALLSRYFLPGMAAKEFKTETADSKKGQVLADFVHNFCGRNNFVEWIFKHFKSTISQIFLAVNDPKHLISTFEIKTSSEKVPRWPAEIDHSFPQKILALLEKTVEEPIWIKVTEADSDCVVKIIVAIASKLSNSSSVKENLRTLHSLSLWLESFSPSYKDDLQLLIPFMTRTLVSKLLNLIYFDEMKTESILQEAVLVFLSVVVKFVVLNDVGSMKTVLISLTDALADLVTSSRAKLSTLALQLLNFIFIQHRSRFSLDHFSEIEEFPDCDKLREINLVLESLRKPNKSLAVSISRLTSTSDLHISPWFLRNSIRRIRIKLQEDFSQLEHVPSELLVDLVQKLLMTVQEDEGKAAEEALKCLSEIGPFDLGSELFREDFDCSVDFLELIIRDLAKILLKSSGNLCIASGNAIASILLTSKGSSFVSSLKSKIQEQHQENDSNEELFLFLKPFSKEKVKEPKGAKVDTNLMLKTVDNPDLWRAGSPHQEWITKLVVTMLKCYKAGSVFSCLVDVCSLSPQLASKIFKLLVYDLLSVGSDDINIFLSVRINSILEDFFDNQNENLDAPESLTLNLESVRTILSGVEYLRLHGQAGRNCWENNFILQNVNYCHSAFAAFQCGKYFLALQMTNIWCYQKGIESKFGSSDISFQGNLIEDLSKLNNKEGMSVLDIMIQSLSKLRNQDGAAGIGRFKTDSPVSRISNLLVQNKNNLAASLCDSYMTPSSSPLSSGLISSLLSMGMYHTLSQYLAAEENPQVLEYQQECSWRLEKWDQLCSEEAGKSFHGCILGGLESVVHENVEGLKSWIDKGLNFLGQEIKSLEIESCAVVYPELTKLRQLSELRSIGGADQETIPSKEGLIETFQSRDNLPVPSFSLLEPIVMQRMILMSRIAEKPLVDNMALHVSKMARNAHMYWVSNQLNKFYTSKSLEVRLEEAQVLYDQGQKEAGIQMARKLAAEVGEPGENHEIYSKIYLNLGTWLDECKAETSSTILEKYWLESMKFWEQEATNDAEVVDAYYAVGSLTDKLYSQTRDFLNSSQFKDRTEALEMNKKESAILVQAVNKQKDLNIPRVIKERFCNLDSQEVQQYKKSLMQYLKMSINYYLSLLANGNKSMAVYRLISLWFSEGNHDLTEIANIFHIRLPCVPTHKFIPLLYQMAARMQLPIQNPADFSSVLYDLILRCTEEHPHHAIPIILALVNAKEDEQYVDNVKASQTKENDPRAASSARIINDLEKSQRQLVARYKFMCKALIELAYAKPSSNTSCNIPASSKITKIRDWSDVAVLTDTVPIRQDGDYSNIVGIVRYASKYSMVGGVNAPKKIMCSASDGRDRPQLVKGKDDLRQDAVMEQVFGLLNELLILNPESRKRKLKVRTYKVAPLSQRSGILEWCLNTQPLSLYLEGPDKKSGAHKRYHPKELDSHQCRAELTKANPRKGGSRVGLETKLKLFKKICAQFSPAMKYFFFEKFPSAGSYYQSMMCYTRSVAVNSMVGHILGLGDRHTNNILIDNATGEIIHIDLGVAFEQGRILPTPETIPFRLTRDIVDGFGPSGVEGVFRKCCERSMAVLRDNSSAVLTVLEVLLHDPLYNWSVGPGKAAARQEAGLWEQLQKESDGGNKMANRALLVLSSKLEGREDGALLSVEGQVAMLIQKARDPENLCAVFEGWAQWC